MKDERKVAPAEPFEKAICEMAKQIVNDLADEYVAKWTEPTDEPLTDPRIIEVSFKDGKPEFEEAPLPVARQYVGNPAAKKIISTLLGVLIDKGARDAILFACEGWSMKFKHGDPAALRENRVPVKDTPGRKDCLFCLVSVRRGTYRIEQCFENGKRFGELDITTPESGESFGAAVPGGVR